MKRCTEQDFLNDVAEHEMSVLLDNGLFRCVRFARKKDSWLNQFTLTTWPAIAPTRIAENMLELEDALKEFQQENPRG